MVTWNNYLIPETLQQAIVYMESCHSSCLIVSGGTDLLLELQQGRRPPVDSLIDVTRIPELCELAIKGDRLYIGAAVPLKQLAISPLIKRHARALAESTGQIGGPQVRAVGTLGGNVGHALPAGDGAISLLALDAAVLVAGVKGLRTVPLTSLYLGPGISALKAGKEIIVAFTIPLIRSNQASAFSRVMRPQGVALPIINMACWLEAGNGVIKSIRIAAGPSGPVPGRAGFLEEYLTGKPWNRRTNEEAHDSLHASYKFRTSNLRASSAYRDHLAEVLLERVMDAAWERANIPEDEGKGK